MKIKPITQQDADKAYETVKDNGNPQYGDKTYALELCRFDDGKALYFCAGTLYDGDEFDHYCRLGIENPRAVLADFEFDYPMPWDPNNEYGDVIDTELSLPIGQDDVEWLNEKANDIANGYESGELVASSCGKKKGKKKPVTSGNLSMKERAANREFEKQQKEHYAKPGTERAQGHHDDKVRERLDVIHEEFNGMHYVTLSDLGEVAYSLRYYFGDADVGGNKFLMKIQDCDFDISDDSWVLMHDLFAKFMNGEPYNNNGDTLVVHNEGDEIWIDSPANIDESWKTSDIREFSDALMENVIPYVGEKISKALTHRKSLESSRRPIQSMYVTEDISGNDLYTRLWSGGKDQFDSMIEDGADPDDILNACEELLFREEGNPPTMTELNNLIWFEPDTIREYIGLSNPIESGCHGKSKKGKKKAVKSAAQISEIHNATSDCFVRITRSDVPEVGKVNDTIPLYEFKDNCRSYAETTNGSYYVTMDDTYEGKYFVEFSTGDTTFAPEDQRDDPYYNESLGTLQFEVIWNPGQELCNYLND